MGNQTTAANPTIAPDQLPRRFERFYRIDASRRNSGENQGLGLPTVKAVALMHHGSVFARSSRGMTTIRFNVALDARSSRPGDLPPDGLNASTAVVAPADVPDMPLFTWASWERASKSSFASETHQTANVAAPRRVDAAEYSEPGSRLQARCAAVAEDCCGAV